jgi:kinetochore protein NNF1
MLMLYLRRELSFFFVCACFTLMEKANGLRCWNRPHTLPPQSILSARLSSIHASQQSQLNARLQTTQSQNAILAEKLGSQRREIEDLLGVLDRVVRDLEDAGDKLGAEVEMGLDGEAREAEEGMVEI